MVVQATAGAALRSTVVRKTTAREVARAAHGTHDAPKKTKEAIGLFTIAVLLSTALLFDGLQWFFGLLNFTIVGIPIAFGLNLFITIFANIFFFFFFLFAVEKAFTPDAKGMAVRLVIFIGELVTELAPFINGIPAITLGVGAFIFVIIAEEALKRKAEEFTLSDTLRIATTIRRAGLGLGLAFSPNALTGQAVKKARKGLEQLGTPEDLTARGLERQTLARALQENTARARKRELYEAAGRSRLPFEQDIDRARKGDYLAYQSHPKPTLQGAAAPRNVANEIRHESQLPQLPTMVQRKKNKMLEIMQEYKVITASQAIQDDQLKQALPASAAIHLKHNNKNLPPSDK